MSRSAHYIIRVAIGIIINSQREVLVALRPAHNPHGGLWEFPGGKFEPHETPFQALKREVYEEVGIEIISATPLITIEHTYPSVCVELNSFIITEYNGTPFGREGQDVRWVNHDELNTLTFPDGNKVIIEKVKEALSQPLMEKN